MTTEKAPVMTVKEFLSLPVRERDAFVADNAMGWRAQNHKVYGWVYQRKYRGGYMPLPRFTDEWADAKIVVDSFTVGWWWTIKSPFYPGAQWTAGLCPHNVTGWNGCPDHFASAETMPLAVCIAALLAVGALREDGE